MHPINRRQLGWNLGRALGAAALASAGLGARAQTGTPRILVGFPAGARWTPRRAAWRKPGAHGWAPWWWSKRWARAAASP